MEVRVFAPSQADREVLQAALGDPAYRDGYAGGATLAQQRAGTSAITRHGRVRQPRSDVAVERCTIAGVPCERLTPRGVSGPPRLVYLHGGGFVRGSLDLGRANATHLAATAGLPLVAIGYPQAPEHPYPAAPDAVAAVHRELRSQGPLAVVGESSGGCLALGLAVRFAADADLLPTGIAALSPMTDLELGGASWHYNAHRDVADLSTGRRMVALYMGERPLRDPLASPVLHPFGGSCPLLLAIGSHETMLSDTERLARNATDAGAPVRLDVHLDMPHGFTRFEMPAAARALDEAAHWCRALLAQAQPRRG